MTLPPPPPPTRARDLAGLAAFVLLCLGVSALGAWVTATSVGGWYQGLAKPAFNPPDWVFAPVWTALYLMIAVAGWRVWRRRGTTSARGVTSAHSGTTSAHCALGVYALQLALNLAWSFIFFGAQAIGIALAEIALLLGAIVVNLRLFWRIDRAAGLLLAPYALWVAFAAVLNAALWRLN